MAVSTRGPTAAGPASGHAPAEQIGHKANSELAPAQPLADAGTNLEQAAERFRSLLGHQPDSPKTTTDAPTHRPVDAAQRPDWPDWQPAASQPSRESVALGEAAAPAAWADARADVAPGSPRSATDESPPAPDWMRSGSNFEARASASSDAPQTGQSHSPSTTADAPTHRPVDAAQRPDWPPANVEPETHLFGSNRADQAHQPSMTTATPARAPVADVADVRTDRQNASPQALSTGADAVDGRAAARSDERIATAALRERESIPIGAFSTGDRILQAFSHPGVPIEQNTATAALGNSDAVRQIEQLGERLAQRILVSDRNQIGTAEVRIQLRESILEGSEIRLHREHGQLVVNIQIPHANLARQVSGQADGLQQTLANRLETSVRVEVQVSTHDTSGDASPGDGRSRNRRDPWEAAIIES